MDFEKVHNRENQTQSSPFYLILFDTNIAQIQSIKRKYFRAATLRLRPERSK